MRTSTGWRPRSGDWCPTPSRSKASTHRLQSAGNLFSVFFTDEQVDDYDAARRQEAFRYAAFFHAMLSYGVYLPPSAYEAWFVSAAHDDAALETIVEALPHAARAAAQAEA